MYVIVKVMMVRVDLVMLNPVVPLIQALAARLMREKVAHALRALVVVLIQAQAARLMREKVAPVMQNQAARLMREKVAWLMREKVAPVMQVKVVNAIQGLEAAGLARQFVLSVIRYYRISLESDLNFGCAASRNHSKRTDSVFNNHTSDCSNLVSAVS
jgi:hypothetical protein